MLDRLAETFIAGVELLEAEGRVARDQAADMARSAVLFAACVLAALLGGVTGLVGLTWMLVEALGTGPALTIVGLGLTALSAAVAMIAGRRLKHPGEVVMDDDQEDRIRVGAAPDQDAMYKGFPE